MRGATTTSGSKCPDRSTDRVAGAYRIVWLQVDGNFMPCLYASAWAGRVMGRPTPWLVRLFNYIGHDFLPYIPKIHIKYLSDLPST